MQPNYKINIPAYLAVLWILLASTSAIIIYKYANRKVFSWHTYISVYMQYFCAFGIILMIPLDLAVTIVARRTNSDKQYYDDNVQTMLRMYLSLYWPTLILSNIILTFQEQYNCNGGFTTRKKITDSLRQLSLQAFAAIVVGAIFFTILVVTNVVDANTNAVLLTSILITNTLWLILLMFLLGYGLITFPISIWRRGDLRSRLKKIQYEAAQEFEKLTYAYSDIFLCISDIQKTKKELDSKKYVDPSLKSAMGELISDCPLELTSSNIGTHQSIGTIIVNNDTNNITIEALADYRQKLYWDTAAFTTSQGKLNKLQMKAYFLEDLIDAVDRTDGIQEINWSFKPTSSYWEYVWFIKIKPIGYRVVAIACAIASICSYLGVISSIRQTPLQISPYFVVVHSDNITEVQIALFVLATIGYTCYITAWALFRMRISKVMELVGNRVTWPIPMSINSRILACLSAPLVFFYLGWLHENRIIGGSFELAYDGSAIYTTFSQFYQIRTIPIMGNSFNAFFPILMICVSALAMVNMLNKFLVSCRCPGLQFDSYDVTDGVFEEGKLKLSERKKLIKIAYTKALESSSNTHSKTVYNMFSLGFTQQSKFNYDWVLNDHVEEIVSDNDSNASATPTKPTKPAEQAEQDKPLILTRKVGSFTDVFKKYTAKVFVENV